MQLHSIDLKSIHHPLCGFGMPKFPSVYKHGIGEVHVNIKRRFLDITSSAFQVNILVGRRLKM